MAARAAGRRLIMLVLLRTEDARNGPSTKVDIVIISVSQAISGDILRSDIKTVLQKDGTGWRKLA